MNPTDAQPQVTGTDQQGERKFKTMNIRDIKKDKPTKLEAPMAAPLDQFAGMNMAAMNNFPFAMFSGMSGMNGLFQPNFGLMMNMAQSMMPTLKPAPVHNAKKAFTQQMVQLDSYKDDKLIREKFECLRDFNDPKFRPESIKDAEFFIIRSSNDDDFHKAVKYGIWSSSQKNNHILQDAYSSSQRKDGKNRPVFLFFTVVNSDQYTGVAQMASDVDFSKSFGYWWEKTKWTGVFKIKWIFVKDVMYSNFNSIYQGDKPVTQHRDGTRLDYESGMKMLRIFSQTEANSSIFDAFDFMDEREEKMRIERDLHDSVAESTKTPGGYQGHGHREHRHHRERDRDRERERDGGHYQKKSGGRYGGNSEYHPKRKEGGSRRDNDREEREERSEEKQPGIIIQKKTIKGKKHRGGNKEYTKKPADQQGSTPSGTEALKVTTTHSEGISTANVTVDVPKAE